MEENQTSSFHIKNTKSDAVLHKDKTFKTKLVSMFLDYVACKDDTLIYLCIILMFGVYKPSSVCHLIIYSGIMKMFRITRYNIH